MQGIVTHARVCKCVGACVCACVCVWGGGGVFIYSRLCACVEVPEGFCTRLYFRLPWAERLHPGLPAPGLRQTGRAQQTPEGPALSGRTAARQVHRLWKARIAHPVVTPRWPSGKVSASTAVDLGSNPSPPSVMWCLFLVKSYRWLNNCYFGGYLAIRLAL